jgi:peptidoglycan-associated lipoprotein
VYFELDSSEVRADSRAILAAHAEYLSAHPSIQVRLEGHADERGSREYNLALSERRAKAVMNHMTLSGMSEQQVGMIVGYGEEFPAMAEQTEEAWSKNRRVEIMYPENILPGVAWATERNPAL